MGLRDLGAAIHVFDEVAHCCIFQQLESAVSEARVLVWVDGYVPRFLTTHLEQPVSDVERRYRVANSVFDGLADVLAHNPRFERVPFSDAHGDSEDTVRAAVTIPVPGSPPRGKHVPFR